MIELVIESNRRASLAQALRELWTFRVVAWAFAERNVRLKYKQAVLGVAWAIIQPLSFLAVFVVLFGRFAKIGGGATSYPAFALSSLIPWTFLQTAAAFGAGALLMDGSLVKKVYFAREAPVLGAVLGTGLDFAIGLGMMLILGPFLGMHFTWYLLLAIPLWGLLFLLASGIALAMAALTVYYRDFRYALPLFIQLWMFASPVAYPVTAVPERWRTVFVLVNPAAGILEGFRRVLALGQPPDFALLAFSGAASLLVAWLGYKLFKYLEPGFADVV
ncbi:MAG TPA: ABC transporter permease [bacterium]|nr:ABC transporter permease [bacterium]